MRFSLYQKGELLVVDDSGTERSGFFSRCVLYICSGYLEVLTSGMGLNIEQELKKNRVINTVTSRAFLKIDRLGRRFFNSLVGGCI